MGGPRRLLLEPTGSTLWEKFERSLSVLCNGRCNGFLTAAGAPELFIALQNSINRSGPGGRNAGGKTTPIPVDLSHRAPLGPPWFVRGSMLPPRHGLGGGAAPAAHTGGGRFTHHRTSPRYLWDPQDASQTNGPSTTTHTWAGWPVNMPLGTRFLGPHLRRPGKAVNMGHAHAAPYPDS